MRRKERVQGSAKMEEEMVWEILKQRTLKNSEESGNPAAWKINLRRSWIVGKRGEEGTKSCERRIEAA